MPAACNSRLYTCSFSTKIEQTTIKAESYKAYLATGIDAPCAIVPIPLTIVFFTSLLFHFLVFSSSLLLLLLLFFNFLIFYFLRIKIESYFFLTISPTIKSTCNSYVISIPIRIILISLFTHNSLLISIFFTLMCSNYYLTTCNPNPF